MALRIAHANFARGYRGGERQTEILIRELSKRKTSSRRSSPGTAPSLLRGSRE